jgi:hypothetical protein
MFIKYHSHIAYFFSVSFASDSLILEEARITPERKKTLLTETVQVLL